MAEKSFPWTANATGDGTSGGYTALEWSEIWRQMFLSGNEASQGVMKGVGSELAVSGTSSPLSVAAGAAVVYGKFYQNTASTTVTVTTPVVGTTGGHVILRLDWVAQTVRVVAVRNTDGVNSTPSLTQSTSTQWEIRLATFTITTGGVITVTDARAYAHFSLRVSEANLDASIAGNGLAGGAGTALSVNVDSSTIEINSDTLRVKDDGIDDTKVGNRVPQFYRRQGGSASNWTTTGTSAQTPGMVRMQAGSKTVLSGGSTVTFPVAFSQTPIAFVTCQTPDTAAVVSSIGASSMTITCYDLLSGGVTTGADVYWLAIGTE